jgi:hypothetical protein
VCPAGYVTVTDLEQGGQAGLSPAEILRDWRIEPDFHSCPLNAMIQISSQFPAYFFLVVDSAPLEPG